MTVLVMFIGNHKLLARLYRRVSKYRWLNKYLQKYLGAVEVQGLQPASLSLLKENKGSLTTAILFQAAILMCDILTAQILLKAFQVDLSFLHTVLALVLATVIGSLPITPGAVITYETAFTYFLTLFGAQVHAALIVTLLYRFFTFWLPIPLGILLYRNLQKPGELNTVR